MPDLWPAGIESKRIVAPVTILREQATYLGQKTQNIVKAEVKGAPPPEKELFRYDFYLIGVTIGYYRFKLLTIYHDVSLYPVDVAVEGAIERELLNNFAANRVQRGYGVVFEARNAEEFKN